MKYCISKFDAIQGCLKCQSNVQLSDEIPIRGFIGDLQEGSYVPHKHFISFFTHHQFHFEYNVDEVSHPKNLLILICWKVNLNVKL